jgi:hypothetical protein
MPNRSTFWLVACLVGLSSGRAVAQPAQPADSPAPAPVLDDATRAAARDLGAAGTQAYLAGNYEEASEKLERAFQLMPVPSLGLWSARALAKRGLLAQAAERYSSVQSLALGPGNPKVQLEAQRSALVERAELVPRVPHLRVTLNGARPDEVTLMVDGAPAPALVIGERWPVNPGTHRVLATRGTERSEASSEVREGQTAEVVLQFSAPTPTLTVAEGNSVKPAADNTRAAPSAPHDANRVPWRDIGWVTLGVGGATLVTSGIIGFVAKQKGDELRGKRDVCRANDQCLNTPEVRSYNRLVDLSTVGWIGGAVLAGAGTLLVLTAPESDGAVEVGLGLSAVSVSGHF